ncbi:MAG: YIP1 family protein [Verrucomicrobiota bacterium]
MIKALLLIFSSPATWTRLSEMPRKWTAVLFGYAVPMVLLACLAEGFGLVHWGKPRIHTTHLAPFSMPWVIGYETFQFLLSLGLILGAAQMIKSLGGTFHGRHTYSQTFTVAAYGLSPLFLLRLLDVFPSVSPWLTWAVGIVLCISVLYAGIPLIMRPDPPHALGLYLMTSLLLLIVTGLMRFVTAWFVAGKFGKLDDLISRLTT